MTIDAVYARQSFEAAADPETLAGSLSRELTKRLAGAKDKASEAVQIVSDLKRIGHPLYSWDESDDFLVWGDDYVNPPGPRRFIVECRWSDGEEPQVAVHFRNAVAGDNVVQ
jgi:hypothetical protein